MKKTALLMLATAVVGVGHAGGVTTPKEIDGLRYDDRVQVGGTGFFRLECTNGVWRFITPGGHGFFLAGNNGPSLMRGDTCPALGYSQYTEAMKKQYGTDKAKWAADSNARMREWGFNTVSSWDDPVKGIITNGIVSARVIQLGKSYAKGTPNNDSNLLDNVNCKGRFPNVFRPDFEEYCRKMAKKHCTKRRNDPTLIGWYTDNEISWRGAVKQDENNISDDAHDGAGMYDAVAQLQEGHSGRKALEAFLAKRGLKIGDAVPLKVKQDFLRLVAERYYRITTSAIREVDKNHLLFGCRFAGFRSTPDIAWEEGGKWNDAMTVNSYPPADMTNWVVRAGWKDTRPIREKIREAYALCKRPIIITEWSYPAYDTGHPNKHGAGQRVATQKDRAAAATLFARTMISLPCMVGYVHFRWCDEPKLGRWKMTGGEDCNYGLVNEDGEPYKLLTEAFTEVHRTMYDFRRIATALPEKAGLPKDEFAFRRQLMMRRMGDNSALYADPINEPIAEAPDELYLEFSRNGNRINYENRFFARERLLTDLIAAEEKEGKGRYLPKMAEVMGKICEQRSWVLPAHDKPLTTFNDTRRAVDLASSELAVFMAVAVDKFGDKLPPELVARVKSEVWRRIFTPINADLTGGGLDAQKEPDGIRNGWILRNNNWNAVCWDNVVCAVCALIDDRQMRARYIQGAMQCIERYLSGFTEDGYCSEGVGYWNYGYGHHLGMGMLLRKLSNGKIDIFTRPIQRKTAEYAAKFMLAGGISPAFADGNGAPIKVLTEACENLWPGSIRNPGEYTVFPQGGVWLMRNENGFSVAFKGGHNGEFHNHNDVGSYFLMDGGKFISGDCGSELYRAQTFSDRRYESKILNSYGHPVPVVNGQLQGTGRRYRGELVSERMEGDRRMVELELKGAYDVAELESLRRTFVYDRKANTFQVTDRMKATKPIQFEDAYLTFLESDNCKQRTENSASIRYDKVGWGRRPEVSATGGEFKMADELIANPERMSPHRVSVKFAAPVAEAEVTFTFR